MAKKVKKDVRVTARHYCSVDQTHRVYPYDGMETATLAPLPGITGADVLLRSYNSQRYQDKEAAMAWCWACDQWVNTVRRTRSEYVLDYLTRDSVQFRLNGNRYEMANQLSDLVQRKGSPNLTPMRVVNGRLERTRQVRRA